MAVVEYIHDFITSRSKRAACTCGWQSAKPTNNKRKSWRQHVTRGTRA